MLWIVGNADDANVSKTYMAGYRNLSHCRSSLTSFTCVHFASCRTIEALKSRCLSFLTLLLSRGKHPASMSILGRVVLFLHHWFRFELTNSRSAFVSVFALTVRELRVKLEVSISLVHYTSGQVFWIQITPHLQNICFFHISLWPCLVHLLNPVSLHLFCKHCEWGLGELKRTQLTSI